MLIYVKVSDNCVKTAVFLQLQVFYVDSCVYAGSEHLCKCPVWQDLLMYSLGFIQDRGLDSDLLHLSSQWNQSDKLTITQVPLKSMGHKFSYFKSEPKSKELSWSRSYWKMYWLNMFQLVSPGKSCGRKKPRACMQWAESHPASCSCTLSPNGFINGNKTCVIPSLKKGQVHMEAHSHGYLFLEHLPCMRSCTGWRWGAWARQTAILTWK